jgi:hypothetical protein
METRRLCLVDGRTVIEKFREFWINELLAAICESRFQGFAISLCAENNKNIQLPGKTVTWGNLILK